MINIDQLVDMVLGYNNHQNVIFPIIDVKIISSFGTENDTNYVSVKIVVYREYMGRERKEEDKPRFERWHITDNTLSELQVYLNDLLNPECFPNKIDTDLKINNDDP